MSSGPADARAVSDLGGDVNVTAYRLMKALRAARRGHRGLVPAGLLETVNRQLSRVGLKVIIEDESKW